MANIGVSFYNVDETVDKLMAFQYLRLNQMRLKQKTEETEINAYGALQKLFTTFQDKLTSLSQAFSSISSQVTSSNPAIATASIFDNSVAIGSHTVVVSNLAQSQINTAQTGMASKTSAAGIVETLTFTNQSTGTNFSVPISGTDSLMAIRDNINNAASNIGVTASIVASTAVGGSMQYNLVLTSDSGTANQINITGDTGNYFNFSQTTAAQDAQFTFDGFNEVRSSNTVDDVMDGLSFNLLGIGSTVISVTPGPASTSQGVQSAIQDMLMSYNAIITFLDGNQMVAMYDDKNKQQANANNSAFPLIKMQLQEAVNTIFNGVGDIHSIQDAGIVNSGSSTVADLFDTQKDKVVTFGSLQIDNTAQPTLDGSTTFNWVLSNDFNSLQEYFTNPDTGLIANLNNVINNSINPASNAGVIWNATNTINNEQGYTDDQIQAEIDRLGTVREGMVNTYARLNAMLSYYQNLSDSLEKQFSYLDSLSSSRR